MDERAGIGHEKLLGEFSQIAGDVLIGEGTVIWHHVNLFGCTIGRHCRIGSFVEIMEGARLGNFVKVEPHVLICKGIVLETGTFVGPGTMFLDDHFPRSLDIDRNGHIIPVVDYVKEPTHVKGGATVGGGCTILPGIRIGEFSMVGAGSVVTRDVPPYSIVVGNPARVVGQVPDRSKWETCDWADVERIQ